LHPPGLRMTSRTAANDGSLWSLWNEAPNGVEAGRWYVAPDPGLGTSQRGLSTRQLSYDHSDCSSGSRCRPARLDRAGEATFYLWGDYGARPRSTSAAATSTLESTSDNVEQSGHLARLRPSCARWARLREASGTLHFETSPDGYAWTDRACATSPPFITSATVSSAAAPGHGASGSRIEFDNVDVLP